MYSRQGFIHRLCFQDKHDKEGGGDHECFSNTHNSA